MEVGAGGGGGSHADGGGGFSGGDGQLQSNHLTANGNAGTTPVSSGDIWCSGGGYFQSGSSNHPSRERLEIVAYVGGQGGHMLHNSSLHLTSGGDGGIAGKGGIIRVSSSSTVYAYNGNECSLPEKNDNGTSNTDYYYKPLEIYAQNGILRKVYKYNCYWGTRSDNNYDYYSGLFGTDLESTVSDIVAATSVSTVTNNLIRDEIVEDLENNPERVIKSGYINPITNTNYGVGSGAGYIELENGTYHTYDENNKGEFITE